MLIKIDEAMRDHALELARKRWGTVRQEGLSCAVGGNWFVVATEARHEMLASAGVAERGFVAYLPQLASVERRGHGRSRIVARPMFPGYLFVMTPGFPEFWHRVKSVRGVRRILADGDKPKPVPASAIEVVRLIEAQHAQEAAIPGAVWHFAPGDVVRIRSGPFAWLYAQLTSAVDKRDRIAALIDILGRKVQVDLSVHDIEAL